MTARWQPRPIQVFSMPESRAPEILVSVIQALDVENEPRYRAEGPLTWCNLFVWDFTTAMRCEWPHWWNNRELTANGMILWMRTEGVVKRGWRKLDEAGARRFAGMGAPAVATWENVHGGSGHVAVVRPTPPEMTSPLIAQAGRVNFSCGPLERGFGKLSVAYYGHE